MIKTVHIQVVSHTTNPKNQHFATTTLKFGLVKCSVTISNVCSHPTCPRHLAPTQEEMATETGNQHLQHVMLWHMPHGIILLTSPRNNNSCYLLFQQLSSGHFHATPCILSYLWFPSHDLLAFTKSTHCHFFPRSEGTNAYSSSSSYLHS